MTCSTFRLGGWLLLCAVFFPFQTTTVRAQPFVPADVGSSVAGYQDDFTGSALASGWQVRGGNVYSVANGMLRVNSTTGDPNHLLYAVAGYNNSVQEVLARLRVINFGTGDFSRGGLAVAVDPAANPAGGIDLHFRDENLGRHLEFLDDLRAWGTEQQFVWQNNTWYWLRLRHEPNAASQGGANDVFAKIWRGDGSEPEPAGWQNVMDYIPARSARTGFAGIAAGSGGGTSDFEVDYVLIKAAGLPTIVPAPAAFPLTQTPVAITNQPQSRIVQELDPVEFTVGASGNPAPTFQWFKNESAISGATNAVYGIPSTPLSDHGAMFEVRVANVASNVNYAVTSAVVNLTVNADLTPPSLLLAQASGLFQVQLFFSERIAPLAGTNVSNYALRNGGNSIVISNITLGASQSNITLHVASLTEGNTYTLTVNGVRDRSAAANVIASNSQISFTAASYAPVDIGNAMPAGGTVAVPGGYNVTGGGTDIGGTSDQFQFSYQQRGGDFDLKVRVESLSFSDAWAEAGLMARESLAAGSRFASVMATPTSSGAYFQSRSAANGATTLRGSFPVSYPNTWLRLQRVGNQFSGYASFDGQNWTALGTVNLALPSNLYFGLAVSSHKTNRTAVAAFRDLSGVVNPGVDTRALPAEALGQSDRKTSVVISEIMYHPADTRGQANTNAQGLITNSLEFVELFNSVGTPEDISGYHLSGDVVFTFPPGTVVPGGSFLVVAKSPADLQPFVGAAPVLGPFSGQLPNSSGTVQLRNRIGAIYLEVGYDSVEPWPVAADGGGPSLVLARPSWGEENPRAWAASDLKGGSPGRLDAVPTDPARNVRINEFLAHTDDPVLDFIELYNHSDQSIDISGFVLSDDADLPKFVIPSPTILGPRGFISWNQNQLGFALDAAGETLWLHNAARTRVLDVVRYEGQANGRTAGRYPDGAPAVGALSSPSPGATNGNYLSSAIVINEIMYHPISNDDDDQFIELHNTSATTVSVAGWRLTDGIDFTFPLGAAVPPHGYLVVGRNAARLAVNYVHLGPTNLVGDFGGRLAGSGERLALARPDSLVSTNNQGTLITNIIYVVVDEVTYGDGGRWGQWSDGGGSSLELLDPRNDNRVASSWTDSDETSKAAWGTFSVTGVLDHGDVAADQLQALLLGVGECLLDDVEVLNASGANQIANSTFESGAAGWTAEGTEETSGLETSGGFNSARSYHVRAVERGDNQINRIRTPLMAPLQAGTSGTIRGKVRWLRGHPELLLRLRGKWLELFCPLVLPKNLGTPGARNSRALSNAPPAMAEVSHAPILPAANQPCVVTAWVSDPDGPITVSLRYRLDPGADAITVPMRDDGTGGDALARDGIFSGSIQGQAAGTMVAFHVIATDALGAAATFPDNAPVRECLVRFGEIQPAGNFPVYRIWMTQATLNTWNGRSKLNNSPLDITFVLGGQRVIYNAFALYAGSPYIAPGYTGATAGRCAYTLSFPSDDRFLGSSGLVLDWPGGHGNENTAMQEQMGYWIADKLDLAFSHRYHIRLHVNGVTDDQRGHVFEAVIQPGREFIEAWMPDLSEGDFYKIDRAFEFNDAGGLTADPMPRLDNYVTTGGAKKTARYRGSWLKRAGESYANFTNLFQLVDAANAVQADAYTAQMEAAVDIDQWMRILGVEHIIVNFDSWGHEIGKNMYAYKPDGGKWQLYMFDLDWLMLAAPGRIASYAANSASMFTCEDPNITKMFNHPPFRRAYFRCMQDAVDGPLVSANCDPVMDAKYAALLANGIQFSDGQGLGPPTLVKQWFSDRRGYLVGQLATVAAPFAVNGTNKFTVSSNLVTLTGTAPVAIKTIEINGIAWPVTWTGVNTWSLRIPVAESTNVLTLLGYDLRGDLVTGSSNQVTVLNTGSAQEAAGAVVINEILAAPSIPGAEFVELFNTSSDHAFDLAGWRVNGLDYVFPEGSFIAPRSYLVLGRDRTAGAAVHGSSYVPFDLFAGNLQSNGETLTLLQPSSAGEFLVVDKVRYERSTPWPQGNDGYSLQVTDASRDNARVSNWADGSGWRFFSFTGTTTSSRLIIFLDNAVGEVYIDDISLVAGGVPNVGSNLVRNGGFEGPVTTNMGGPWIFAGAVSNSVVDSNVKHSGNASLRMVFTAPGSAAVNVNQDTLPIVNGATYTLSYWYLPVPNDVRLTTRMSTTFRPNNSLKATLATPGTANSAIVPLPAYPELWINEVQPRNNGGLRDDVGEADPWIELHNSGNTSIALEGYYLSDTYTNLTRSIFPSGTTIAPGQFLTVFVDGEPSQAVPGEAHANFRLGTGSGSIVLSRLVEGTPQIVDYINYPATDPGQSYGSFPDGQPFDRNPFYFATPGATNTIAGAPIVVFINEWMAGNTRTISDPAVPGQFDDWFELYNPGAAAVDLAGYFLTDALTNKFQFRIPQGYSIPAGGFLLVWADNQPEQNSSNRADLHVSFALARGGEAIGLFAPDGSLIDAVTFANQTDDISQGRAVNGGAQIVFFPNPSPGTANPDAGGVAFDSVHRVGNELTLGWVALPGRSYQLEWTDSLSMPDWQPFGTVLLAATNRSSVTLDVTAAPRRFFRLALLP